MSQTSGLKCMVCKKNKNQLHKRKSRLDPGLELFLCTEDFNAKREPRWLIILTAQSTDAGVEKVKKYLIDRLYVGEEISALDLVK